MSPQRAGAAGHALLVVAPNWLGDLVMSTVLLEALAAAPLAPDGRRLVVDVAVRRRWAPLLAGDPRLRGLRPVARTGRHRGWRGIARLARDWRREGYASVLLLPPSLRAALAAALAGIPLRIGFRSDGRGILLSEGLPAPRRGALHYTQEALLLGRAWARRAGWTWSPPADLAPRLPALAPTVPAGATAGPPVWALATTATYGAAKGWPPARAAEFLEAVVAGEGRRVVLLGDAAAREATDALRARSGLSWRREAAGGPGVVDLVGRTDLMEAAGWLRAAAVCVSIDSGLMHLAASLGTPTLGLFGSTSAAWTGPRGERTATLEAKGFPCQPCFRRRCDREVFCMDSLPGDEVAGAARALLARLPEGGGAS